MKDVDDSDQQQRCWPWVVATILVVAGAILFRLLLNFFHATAPGMDAAYYPLQSQWLIEHGELNIPATPLTFWLQALLAKFIMAASGLSLQDAASLAARLFDGCVPPLAAVPIMMLGYRVSDGRRSAVAICAAIAVLSVFSPPILRMAGDLQKNAFGMVWMATAIWAVRQSLATPENVFRWLILAAVCVLSGLTHIGAFGATLVVLFGCLIGYVVTGTRQDLERETRFPLAKVILGSVVMLGIVALLAPSQALRLGRLVQKVIVFEPRMLVVTVIVYVILAWLMLRLWRKENFALRCDKAIAIGVAIGIAFLFAPIFSQSIAMRFQLMSIVQIAVLLMLYATASRWELQSRPGRILLYATIVLAIAAPFAMQRSVVNTEAVTELKAFGKTINLTNPEKTLVIAPHGLEFWAGHLWNTQVRSSTLPADTNQYERIFFLQPKESLFGPPPRDDRHGPPRHQRRKPRQPEMEIPPQAKALLHGEFFDLFEY